MTDIAKCWTTINYSSVENLILECKNTTKLCSLQPNLMKIVAAPSSCPSLSLNNYMVVSSSTSPPIPHPTLKFRMSFDKVVIRKKIHYHSGTQCHLLSCIIFPDPVLATVTSDRYGPLFLFPLARSLSSGYCAFYPIRSDWLVISHTSHAFCHVLFHSVIFIRFRCLLPCSSLFD